MSQLTVKNRPGPDRATSGRSLMKRSAKRRERAPEELPDDPAGSVEALLAEAVNASPRRRKQIEHAVVSRSLGLARALAHRYRERGEPVDDLMQVAYTGLILAVRRFSPENGARFSTFATPTILGELRRYFRDQTWAIRPPRRLQEHLPRVRQAVADLEQEGGQQPSTEQVADHLGLSVDEVREAQQASTHYKLTSLEGAAQERTPQVATPIDNEVSADIDELVTRMEVASLLDALDDKEREIIRLRFFENLTQQQIADQIGVSQMQVSRLLKRILDQLRELASEDLEDERTSS